MSVRSLGYTARGGFAGTYQFPSVKFSSGLEVEKIRDNVVLNDDQLQDELDATNARITSLNTQLQQLNTDSSTLLTNIKNLQSQINNRLAQVPTIQNTIDTTNLLISQLAADTSTPYNIQVAISQATSNVFVFTPLASTVNQVYNMPSTFFILEGISKPSDLLYNVNLNLQFVGNNPINYQNIANGSIGYVYISNQSKLLALWELSTGCYYFPTNQIEAVNNCQFNVAHSDILNVPANSTQLYFQILISTHNSMTLDANIFSQIGFALNSQTVPMINMSKI